MKIAITYHFALDNNQEEFFLNAQTFAITYRLFPPGIDHDLIVCWNNGTPNVAQKKLFDKIQHSDMFYDGTGLDCGAALFLAERLNHDFVIFCNARVKFWKHDWGKKFVEEREAHGDGLYGASASYEQCPLIPNVRGINPHIRTSCFGCNPTILREYPYQITCRRDAYQFEAGAWNFTRWFFDIGLNCWLVTWKDANEKKFWRSPYNIFRRGDQSNMLIKDKHSDIYQHSSLEDKNRLSRAADYGCVNC
jgi:hypothetical protein